MSGPVLTVTGTWRAPVLVAEFDPRAMHPVKTRRTLLEFVKWLPDRRFDPAARAWTITGTGRNPQRKFSDAGFEILWEDPEGEFAPAADLDDLVAPITHLTSGRDRLLIRPRLLGPTAVGELLGAGAVWESARGRYSLPIAELIRADGPLKGIEYSDEALAAAEEAREAQGEAVQTLPELEKSVAALARSTSVEDCPQAAEKVIAHTGDIPGWFGLDLYPFQRSGALAAAAGHSFIADSPGLGKCVIGDTRVAVNGRTKAIGELWDARAERAYPDPEGDGGELIDLAPGELRVIGHSEEDAGPVPSSASHLYRQRYRGPLVRFDLSDGTSVTCTPVHRFRARMGERPFAWARAVDLVLGYAIGADIETAPGSADLTIESFGVTAFDGYVYDLCVPVTHSYTLANGVWSHNTRQALATAALAEARRILVVGPPVSVTNWGREAAWSRVAEAAEIGYDRMEDGSGAIAERGKFAAGEQGPDSRDNIVVLNPRRKLPDFPDAGVIVVGDRTLASRPALVDQLAAWGPDMLIDDEIHRHKTPDAKSTLAVRRLADATSGLRIGLSGTPMLHGAQEPPSQLAITGHLTPVFGGMGAYYDRYCRKDNFHKWVSRQKMLPELGQILAERVWVRRTKERVLPDLPAKTRNILWVDVDLKAYRASHEEALIDLADKAEAIYDESGRWPTEPEAVYGDPFSALSPLRKACGLAKVDAAADWIEEHLDATVERPADDGGYDRPLIVWAHHREVAEGIAARLAVTRYADDVSMLLGGATLEARDRIVTDFQAGRTAVLIASIHAANTAITLTRSSDVLFAEADWNPADISQAEDRAARIGQTRPVTVTMLAAAETLDAKMHQNLHRTAADLDQVLVGGDNAVSAADLDDTQSAREFLGDLVEHAIAARKRKLARAARTGA